MENVSITREVYEGFQRGEFERWDAVFDAEVEIYSPGLQGGKGLDTLKSFAGEFIKAFNPRIDLVDEYEGNGNRSFITITMHWKHVQPFYGIHPSGREGTSVETFLLTIKDGKVTRFDVADNSLDLAIYLW